MRDWLERSAPALVGIFDWFGNRLTGVRCYAVGCGRLLLFHAPWQSYHCHRVPLGIELTERGWLDGHGILPEPVESESVVHRR